ncbi:MAG: GNAT family N-acetyltransferase [Bowdeniella nasicola]|nr:GNAT family N-acetyltransferase [Bowdeniella nasicola]
MSIAPHLHFHRIPTGTAVDTSGKVNPNWQQLWELDQAEAREWFGTVDLSAPNPASLRAAYGRVGSQRERRHFLLSIDADEADQARGTWQVCLHEHTFAGEPIADVIGVASLGWERTINPHLAKADIYIQRRWRRRGIGRTVVDQLRQWCREAGRSELEGWLTATPATDHDIAIFAVGREDRDAISRAGGATPFALALGAQLRQIETVFAIKGLQDPLQRSALTAHARELTALLSARNERDYELLTFDRAVPSDLREGYARMFTGAERDMPQIAEDETPQVSAQEIAESDERLRKAGVWTPTVVVRHRASGALVGFTRVTWRSGMATAVQEETWVDPAHRGRRLGLWIKAVNLGALLARPGANPETGGPPLHLLLTFNAAENRYMRAINTELGYRVAGVEAVWRLAV